MTTTEAKRDPKDTELAVRTAMLAARMYEMHGWRWGGNWRDDPGFIPDAEALAAEIDRLIASIRSDDHTTLSTGRLMVTEDALGTTVWLELGSLIEGDLSIDDRLISGRGGDV